MKKWLIILSFVSLQSSESDLSDLLTNFPTLNPALLQPTSYELKADFSLPTELADHLSRQLKGVISLSLKQKYFLKRCLPLLNSIENFLKDRATRGVYYEFNHEHLKKLKEIMIFFWNLKENLENFSDIDLINYLQNKFDSIRSSIFTILDIYDEWYGEENCEKLKSILPAHPYTNSKSLQFKIIGSLPTHLVHFKLSTSKASELEINLILQELPLVLAFAYKKLSEWSAQKYIVAQYRTFNNFQRELFEDLGIVLRYIMVYKHYNSNPQDPKTLRILGNIEVLENIMSDFIRSARRKFLGFENPQVYLTPYWVEEALRDLDTLPEAATEPIIVPTTPINESFVDELSVEQPRARQTNQTYPINQTLFKEIVKSLEHFYRH